MREYEIYVPLHLNDGSPIPAAKLQNVKSRIVEHFGGLTHFPQQNEGLWKVGNFTFRDHVVILRVLSEDYVKAERFFARLKVELKREWQQEDVLIVSRNVRTL